jgi:hypothetical protein
MRKGGMCEKRTGLSSPIDYDTCESLFFVLLWASGPVVLGWSSDVLSKTACSNIFAPLVPSQSFCATKKWFRHEVQSRTPKANNPVGIYIITQYILSEFWICNCALWRYQKPEHKICRRRLNTHSGQESTNREAKVHVSQNYGWVEMYASSKHIARPDDMSMLWNL